MDISTQFTLIVPTYNRPQELARLLRYLARHAAAFPVLVLDSGDAESRVANAALAATLDLRLRLIPYNPAITPFEKFWRGAGEVETELCALCADDDVVLADALPPLVALLEQQPDFVAAHGWYFTFSQARHLDIAAVVYRGRSLDQADPLHRLREFFNPYEAAIYAVYRTAVARQVLGEAQAVDSLLARELLAGALTALAGKVGRLPVFYYGRSLRPSESSARWHPVDFLLSSPGELFRQYAGYRRIVLDRLREVGAAAWNPEELGRLVDLIHLKYLSAYLVPEVMDHLIAETMAGTDPREILQGVWPRLNPSPSPLVNRLRRSRRLRRIRDRLAPAFRLQSAFHSLGIAGDQTIRTTTAGGRPRECRLHGEFLAALASAGPPGPANAVDALIRTLDAYE